MKVSELAGAELALWVARAIKLDHVMRGAWPAIETEFDPETHCHESSTKEWKCWLYFKPHEDWAQGGPLLEEYAIGFQPISDAEWQAEEYITARTGRGQTPLIAAMRALVASVYGEEV